MQNEMTPESQFLNKMHDEILRTMERGARLIERKIIFVTALLGVGSLQLPGHSVGVDSTRVLLYLAPLVALLFDACGYQLKFSVRRLGAFLKLHSPSELEREWETFAGRNRDKVTGHFGQIGADGFTLVTFFLAFVVLGRDLLSRSLDQTLILEIVLSTLWFGFLIWAYSYMYGRQQQRLDALEASTSRPALRAPVSSPA